MLTATCHCGAVRIELPGPPHSVTRCNCSICRRLGVLWGYYPVSEVRVLAAPDVTDTYAWGERTLRIVRCKGCGCVTHWERIVPVEGSKMGINANNFPLSVLKALPVELLDRALDD